MRVYRVEITRAARKAIAALPTKMAEKIDAAIARLADDPRPPGSLKLKDTQRTWRIRVGQYRVIYDIYDENITIVVIRVAHRREAYD